jgi:hypothetical protein
MLCAFMPGHKKLEPFPKGQYIDCELMGIYSRPCIEKFPASSAKTAQSDGEFLDAHA